MIKLLADQGKIIISALFNRREYSIPAVYPEVIGVRINITPKVDKYFFNSNCDVQVSIPTEPIIFEYKPGEYTILGGNSLACGIITAHVSEVFSKHGILSYAELTALLKNQTVDDIRIIHEHKTSQLCQNIKQTFEIGELKAEMLKFELFDENGPLYNQLLSKERINKFISALQNRFHTINHKTPMRLSDLESSHSLYEYILKQE